jgi:hypothetical protein
MTVQPYTAEMHADFVRRLKGDIAMYEKGIAATQAQIASPAFAKMRARAQAAVRAGLDNAIKHLAAKRRHLAGAT